ncbi:MAG: bifunctional precorrin-2 dehydrogenase/sirohydrochlorin ferrochelatase [Acidimicrobiales bacterium]|nr:bifunctional precorrin-2 dehydrogenase/sirohydrochlorin ferrochelatase [Acidimicrobiales bacterium]
MSPTYPVHLVLDGKPVLVVGGGNVALRKVAGLLVSGAAVTVVAPRIRPELIDNPGLTTIERPYQRGEVASYRLAITCTDDAAVNEQVFRDGETAGVWVNSADDPVNCGFTLPAVARQGDLAISISTTGRSPALAMWLRRRFEREFDHNYAELLGVLADVRAEARAELGTSEVSGWIEALDAGLLDLVVRGDHEMARNLIRNRLGLTTPQREPASPQREPASPQREAVPS